MLCEPSASGPTDTGLVHDVKLALSNEHRAVVPASPVNGMLRVAVVEYAALVVMVGVIGAIESTVKVYVLVLTLVAASLEVMVKVCDPSARLE